MYAAGVDVGSTQTKAVVVDQSGTIVGRSLIPTGAHVMAAAEKSFLLALEHAAIDRARVGYVVSTGYGRYQVAFGNEQITEIMCHARGAAALFPGTQTVLDMGGQDTKAIRLRTGGGVMDFFLNDKCAAGTGRFLQYAAAALGIELSELGPMALRGTDPVTISTTCTVFAGTEMLSWMAKGKKIEDILLGAHYAAASRAIGLLRRVGIAEELTFTGGVARNSAMVKILGELLKMRLNISEDAHYCGAFGASLFALGRRV